MLYHNNRPVNTHRPSHLQDRFFQWRSFDVEADDPIIAQIESEFEAVKVEDRSEKYFLIPGRRTVMPRLINDETFEIRSLINDNEDIEHWERSVRAKFPLKRSMSALIGSAIPRFRGALNSAVTPDTLCSALSRKSKYFEAQKNRRVFRSGKVMAEISQVEINGETKISIALQCDERAPIKEMVERLNLKKADNTNFIDYLLTA